MVEQDDGAVAGLLPSADSLRPVPIAALLPSADSLRPVPIAVNFDRDPPFQDGINLDRNGISIIPTPLPPPSWIRRVPKGNRGLQASCPCPGFPAGIVCPRFRSVLSFSAKLLEEWDDEPTMPTRRCAHRPR